MSATDWVLDLGCNRGSFTEQSTQGRVVRADLEIGGVSGCAVICSADRLPFRSGVYSAAILNHSLEHFHRLDDSLAEVARVLRAEGLLYVAVPDAGTFTDRVYRWLGRGGGHVNAFTSLPALVRKIQEHAELRLIGSRVLVTSLSFLNRKNQTGRMQRKMWLFGAGAEGFVAALTAVLRFVDRAAGTRSSVYGWACYLGPANARLQIETGTWSNVCVRCGAGRQSVRLRTAAMRRFLLLRFYACPDCGAWNVLTDDEAFRTLV